MSNWTKLQLQIFIQKLSIVLKLKMMLMLMGSMLLKLLYLSLMEILH